VNRPQAILLDVEGTTSSIAFVAEVLFPYARAHLADYVARHPADAEPILAEVAAMEPGDPLATLARWMDEDAKTTPLKTLQGMIWETGYADGTIEGHVYPDTPEALARWHSAGIAVYIYSSGSVAAQRLLFRHSVAGDLTPCLSGHFDTRVGPKRERASYEAIAHELGMAPTGIWFISDIQAEIDAARAAGMHAILIDRDGGAGDAASLAEVLP